MSESKTKLSLVYNKDEYVSMHKAIIRYMGFNKAGVLEYLIDRQRVYTAQNKLYDNMFFVTYPKLMALTDLGSDAVRSLVKDLEEQGLITTKRKGLPCRTYYRVHTDKLKELQDNLLDEYEEESGGKE